MTNDFVPMVLGRHTFLHRVSTSHEFGAVTSDGKAVIDRRKAAESDTRPCDDSSDGDSDMHADPLRRESLTKEQVYRLARVRQAICDAYDLPLDRWTDLFMRLEEPEGTLMILEICAVVYRHIMAGEKRWSRARKQHLFKTIRAIALYEENKGEPDVDEIKGCPSLETISHMLFEALVNRERP